nr:Chain C, SpPBP2a [Streptococcus pneumoniae]6GQN_G Chain G, SpPBP2a [Streptococcus pneumoniae]
TILRRSRSDRKKLA